MSYVMGIDGGGTKTCCLVGDNQGRLLGYGQSGPANTNYVPRQIAVFSLVESIRIALSQSGLTGDQVNRLCISAPTEPGTIVDAKQTSGIKHVFRASEGETPRWAARFWVEERIGVTVDAGTGSLARGWDKAGRLASAGGWGATLGDEGSGYWISLQAMRAILQAHDGRIKPTRLTEAVLSFFRMQDVFDLVFQASEGLVKYNQESILRVAPDSGNEHRKDVEKKTGGLNFRESVYKDTLSRGDIASLCPTVVQVAQQGDWKAGEILHEAGYELGLLGTAVIKRLEMGDDEFAIVPFGGVFRSGSWVFNSFKKTVLAEGKLARVVLPRFQPVVGAVLIALNDSGINITPEVLQNIESTAKKFSACVV
jgi:N-acetylglucosamine kinase